MDARTARRLALLEDARRIARKKAGRARVSAGINVTPLVDVVLVLLIIFMVVTPLLQRAIELPEVREPFPMSAGAHDLNVALDKHGKITIESETVSCEDLAPALSRELARFPGRAVYVHADKGLPFGDVREILSALREAGASDVGLASVPYHEVQAGAH